MRFLLTEQLTSGILSRYSSVIEAADVCLTLRVNGTVADLALGDSRWHLGSGPLYVEIEGHLSNWISRIAMSQNIDGLSLSPTEQAGVTYGLWARLGRPYLARELVRHSVSEAGVRMEDLDIDIVADDPYLRDAFEHDESVRAQVRSVRIHKSPGSVLMWQRWREKLAGNPWLRELVLSHESRAVRWPSRSQKGRLTSGKQRTAAVFFLNQRFHDVFQPIQQKLESRGWRVVSFYYNALQRPSKGALAFEDAVKGIGTLKPDKIPRLRGEVSDELLSQGPVSRTWLRVALKSSHVTAWAQLFRHRRLLESYRPDVVVSLNSETMGLALQCAAKGLGIPSLFLAHGFLGSVHFPWYFTSTASALLGQACMDSNERAPDGTKRRGLVATGYPPYDAMLTRYGNLGNQRIHLRNLDLPVDRSYLVLVFAIWGIYPLWCSLQRKMLKMLADALPSDAFLVCKLHPSLEEPEICEAILTESLPRDAFRVVGEDEFNTPDLLAACHVAVTVEPSMTWRDAIVMGRPTIVIRDSAFPRGKGSCSPLNHPGSDLKETCWLVSDATELRKALFALTREQRARNHQLKHRKEYIEQFLVASDGHAAQRVADLVEHLGAGKDPGCFVPSIGKSLLAE